jgi:2-polyprenyl-3-methyl-5-hydroxy-6-metoxy-1,4-benzoquinol methylase
MMPPRSVSRRSTSTEPVYVDGTGRGEVWAHFPSGTIVRALRDRTRSYPKLAGEAPPTRAIYGALTRLAPNALRVIDAGSGSGAGTARLAEQFDTVIGIDRDPQAVAFAREYAPLASFETADLEELSRGDPADALIVCDVLGHVKRPAAVLRKLRARLSAGATVLIAEPTAHVSQHLRSRLGGRIRNAR